MLSTFDASSAAVAAASCARAAASCSPSSVALARNLTVGGWVVGERLAGGAISPSGWPPDWSLLRSFALSFKPYLAVLRLWRYALFLISTPVNERPWVQAGSAAMERSWQRSDGAQLALVCATTVRVSPILDLGTCWMRVCVHLASLDPHPGSTPWFLTQTLERSCNLQFVSGCQGLVERLARAGPTKYEPNTRFQSAPEGLRV
eukprot:362393-Chlamydomonas_euryale.AAC.4